MLINNNGINNNHVGSSKLHDNSGGSSKTNNAPTGAESDSVKLSSTGHSLSRLETAVASANEVDTNRVEAIRQAINDGSYSIDADAIATKLLDSDSLS